MLYIFFSDLPIQEEYFSVQYVPFGIYRPRLPLDTISSYEVRIKLLLVNLSIVYLLSLAPALPWLSMQQQLCQQRKKQFLPFSLLP